MRGSDGQTGEQVERARRILRDTEDALDRAERLVGQAQELLNEAKANGPGPDAGQPPKQD